MQFIRNTLFASVLVAAALVVVGCNQNSQPNSQQQSVIDNKICPIMEGKVDLKGQTVAWNGKTIGFCCDDCVPTWNKLSDAEKRSKLDAANRPDAKPKEMKNDHEKKKVR